MLQISEIVRKTEEMFDLFNEHFTRRVEPPGHHCIAGRRARGLWLVQYQRDMERQRREISGNQSLRRVP